MSNEAALQEKQVEMAKELLFSGEQLPSFAQGLFLGIFDSQRVFPFPEVSADEKARTDDFCKRLNTWADVNLDADAIDRTADIPAHVIKGLADLGVLGCTISKEYGGLEFTQYAYCRMVEEIARRCGATTLFVNAHQSIGMKALLLYGTKEQKDRWLPPLARGEILAAFALTEEHAGSDANGVETRAVYDPARKAYVINGKKQWITNGGIADILTVMAQTEVDTPKGKQDRVTAFLVTPDMPGFTVTDVALEKVGMRGSKTAKMEFHDIVVPEENILGKLGSGLKLALTVLNFGRTTFGAGCTGNCKDMTERAIAHAKDRRQFDRPLASFGLVKEKIATMAALTYAVDASTYLTAGLLDRGEEDFKLETAIVKVFASEAQWRICYEAMQILGGRSFFTDQPFERYMRDARLNTIGEGANEVLRTFLIAAVGLGDIGLKVEGMLESKNKIGGLGKLLGFGASSLERMLKTPTVPVRSAQLQHEAEQLASHTRKFGIAVMRLLATHRKAVLEKQMLCNRIADGVIALYTVTAVLSKLDSELQRTGTLAARLREQGADSIDLTNVLMALEEEFNVSIDEEPHRIQTVDDAVKYMNIKAAAIRSNNLAIGKLYCTMAFDKIEQSLAGLHANYDDQIEAVSDQLTGLK